MAVLLAEPSAHLAHLQAHVGDRLRLPRSGGALVRDDERLGTSRCKVFEGVDLADSGLAVAAPEGPLLVDVPQVPQQPRVDRRSRALLDPIFEAWADAHALRESIETGDVHDLPSEGVHIQVLAESLPKAHPDQDVRGHIRAKEARYVHAAGDDRPHNRQGDRDAALSRQHAVKEGIPRVVVVLEVAGEAIIVEQDRAHGGDAFADRGVSAHLRGRGLRQF
mmetsp:Transcript_87811/g.253232  ORF Transcript_87811/g.253232 Transcript_87811/m.253232 type:complete len:221 (+) Transcript_87811:157-819(+)